MKHRRTTTHRHQRRTALLALASIGLTTGLLSSAAPVSAAERIATTGVVTTVDDTRLNTRSGPSASSARTGSAPHGMAVRIVCQTAGQYIVGTVRTTTMWNRLQNGSYVSDGYISRPAVRIPTCAPAAEVPRTEVPRTGASGGWTLPVASGVVSAFRTTSRPSHDGIDLGAARNTPIRAVAGGTVIRVVCNASTNNCDVDGSRSISGCGWYVEIQHAENIVTRYCHLVRRPAVQVGETVPRGRIIGHVGSSGASSGPHLHFEVHLNAPPVLRANAVDPVSFMRAKGLQFG